MYSPVRVDKNYGILNNQSRLLRGPHVESSPHIMNKSNISNKSASYRSNKWYFNIVFKWEYKWEYDFNWSIYLDQHYFIKSKMVFKIRDKSLFWTKSGWKNNWEPKILNMPRACPPAETAYITTRKDHHSFLRSNPFVII